MERHSTRHSEDGSRIEGYPRRTIVTKDFHYIRNVFPERWMAGDPKGFQVSGATPFTADELKNKRTGAFVDIDPSPSKAWIILHRGDELVKPLADVILGRHPARELYDLRTDRYEMTNVAEEPAYAGKVKELEARLMEELLATSDPRSEVGGMELDTLPVDKTGKERDRIGAKDSE